MKGKRLLQRSEAAEERPGTSRGTSSLSKKHSCGDKPLGWDHGDPGLVPGSPMGSLGEPGQVLEELGFSEGLFTRPQPLWKSDLDSPCASA